MRKSFMVLRRPAAICILLCASLLAIAACSDDDDNVSPPPPDPNEIATDLTDPAQVIEAHEKALAKKNLTAYEALLDTSFEFFPLQGDATDFPWMDGLSWPVTTELNIIANMFDPNFVGSADSVDLIEMNLTILSQKALSDGGTQLTCTMQGRVLTSTYEGWAFDTRAVFDLVPRNGFLRIAKITEIESFAGRDVSSVDGTSWGNIKNLYRSGD